MTLAKRLLLGSAAGLVAATGAHAADPVLPVAPTVDFVQICTVGAGYTGILLPGTDICMQISGYARSQTEFSEELDATLSLPITTLAAGTGPGQFGSIYSTSVFNASAAVAAAAAPTLNGTTIGASTAFATTGALGGLAAGSTVTVSNAVLGVITGGANNRDETVFNWEGRINFDFRTATELGVLRGFIRMDNPGNDRAFVELATGPVTFIAGRNASFFDPEFTGYALGDGNNSLMLNGTANEQLGITFFPGNGVSFGFAIEADRNSTLLGLADYNYAGNAATITAVGIDSNTMPDFVAFGRIAQAWGSAKLAVAVTEVDPDGSGFTGTGASLVTNASAVGSELGFAIGASADINLPFLTNSSWGIAGHYTHGATGYMAFDGAVGETALPVLDAVIVDSAASTNAVAYGIELTEAFVIATGFRFGITSNIRFDIDGAYAAIDHDTGVVDIFDGSVWAVRGSVLWNPVSDLDVIFGVSYAQSDFDSAFALGQDDDEVAARLRITRNF